MKIKDDVDASELDYARYTVSEGDGFWYGLTLSGLNPSILLNKEDAERVNAAIATLKEFEALLEMD